MEITLTTGDIALLIILINMLSKLYTKFADKIMADFKQISININYDPSNSSDYVSLPDETNKPNNIDLQETKKTSSQNDVGAYQASEFSPFKNDDSIPYIAKDYSQFEPLSNNDLSINTNINDTFIDQYKKIFNDFQTQLSASNHLTLGQNIEHGDKKTFNDFQTQLSASNQLLFGQNIGQSTEQNDKTNDSDDSDYSEMPELELMKE